METHVKVVAVLHIAMGTLGVIGALTLVLIFGGVASLVSASSDPAAALAVPIIGLAGAALVGLVLILSLPSVIIGVGLWRLSAWARVGGIVLGILELVWIPIGTVVGIYTVLVLFARNTERRFAPGARSSIT
jgi:hypothetical protein